MGNILPKVPADAAAEILSLETPNTSSAFKRVMTSGGGQNTNTGLSLSATGVKIDNLAIENTPPVSAQNTNLLRRNPQTGNVEQVNIVSTSILTQNVIKSSTPETYQLSIDDLGSEIEFNSSSSDVNTLEIPEGLPLGFTCYVSLTQGALQIVTLGGLSLVDKANTEITINIESNAVFFITVKSENRIRAIQL